MGELAVQTAAKVAKGEAVETSIPVEIALVNKDNVDQFLK